MKVKLNKTKEGVQVLLDGVVVGITPIEYPGVDVTLIVKDASLDAGILSVTMGSKKDTSVDFTFIFDTVTNPETVVSVNSNDTTDGGTVSSEDLDNTEKDSKEKDSKEKDSKEKDKVKEQTEKDKEASNKKIQALIDKRKTVLSANGRATDALTERRLSGPDKIKNLINKRRNSRL